MSDDALKTLFHPLKAGLLDMPNGGRWIAAGLGAGLSLPADFGAGLTVVQGFKPDHDALRRAGFQVMPGWPDATAPRFDGAMILLGRHRGQNERWLHEAVIRLRPGALVLVAGGKTEGAQSFARRLKPLLPDVGTIAKHHGLAMWFRRPDDAAAASLFPPADEARIDGRFRTAAGMFSHDRIDAGSHLLAAHLPQGLAGAVADFCAGWGYLSAEVAARCPGVASIDLYEADHAALQAARENLAGCPVAVAFHWHDLAAEPVERKYAAIVMNPPFHAGRKAEPSLGQAMIRRAASGLKQGGRLFMVANRQLPYEDELAHHFRSVEKPAEEGGFKILVAQR